MSTYSRSGTVSYSIIANTLLQSIKTESKNSLNQIQKHVWQELLGIAQNFIIVDSVPM